MPATAFVADKTHQIGNELTYAPEWRSFLESKSPAELQKSLSKVIDWEKAMPQFETWKAQNSDYFARTKEDPWATFVRTFAAAHPKELGYVGPTAYLKKATGEVFKESMTPEGPTSSEIVQDGSGPSKSETESKIILDEVERRKNLNPIPTDWQQQVASKGYIGPAVPSTMTVKAGNQIQGGTNEAGQKYTGATQYGAVRSQDSSMLAADTPPGTRTFDTMTNGKPDWFVTGAGNSPAGNNITSGAVNPTTALSGNNLATTATAPGAGTSTFGTNTSFLNPASGTATQKRKIGANKYFNQQWFGGKQIA